MSDSVRPHRRPPTRFPRLWDSPGKNTGVGCHFLLQCMREKSESEVAQSCPTLSRPHGLQPTRLLRPWDFPGKSTGVGCHCLLRRKGRGSLNLWLTLKLHKNGADTKQPAKAKRIGLAFELPPTIGGRQNLQFEFSQVIYKLKSKPIFLRETQ